MGAKFTTIEDVVDEMTRRWLALRRKGDWRQVFATTYLRTTQYLLASSKVDGLFENPGWVVEIDCSFAERYFDAFDLYESTGACPWPWRIAFRSALQKKTFVLQDMLLGMNAHINYDLPLSLHATIPKDTSYEALAPYRRDHNRLNLALTQAVNLVQIEISRENDPLLSVADLVFSDDDEGAAARLIALWRERSWAHFLMLRGAEDEAETERTIEQSASEYGLLLLQFQDVLRPLYWPNRVYRDSMGWVLRRTRRAR